MKLEGKRILVTGGAGFIGSNLVDRLLKEDIKSLVVMDTFARGREENLKDALKDPRVRLLGPGEGDILCPAHLDAAMKDGVDGVFHTASMCLAYCQENPLEGYRANVEGTVRLLEAASAHGRPRIVFSSSSSIYGNAVRCPMDEGHPQLNRNVYGATKICGEALFRAYFHKAGISYLALRYMNVYGPRQDYLGVYVAVIIRIIDRLQQGLRPQIAGDGSQVFDFVYVDDVCEANLLSMKSDISDEAFNVASGTGTSVLDLCQAIMREMESPQEIEFTAANDHTLVTRRIGCPAKAEAELGFKASTTLAEGLRRTIAWKLKL